MEIIYKQVQSSDKPIEIDITSSPGGVYVRRNIKQVEKELDNGEKSIYYDYQEAFLNPSEWEQYSSTLLVSEINGEENSKEFEEYKAKLKTPVEYINGKFYKPSWIDLYSGIIDEFAVKIDLYGKAGGDIKPIVELKTAIYDITAKAENAEMMTVKQVIDLWLFLYQKKEQYFKEYKEEISK